MQMNRPQKIKQMMSLPKFGHAGCLANPWVDVICYKDNKIFPMFCNKFV